MNIFKRLGSFILDTLQIIVFAVAIFLFVYLLILQPHKIKGQSMEPNFDNGEFLLTDKVTYRFNDPKRGDVIVFKAPPDYEEEYIKRIIGLPGETVAVINGKIIIDGQPLTEDYLPTGTYTNEASFVANGKSVIVPSDSYFVVGDNRGNSYDSRSWGFISGDKITGRAWFVYWPLNSAGLIEAAVY